MPTGTAGKAAQELPFCAVNYSRRPIAYNSSGIKTASTFVVATLPPLTLVRECIIRVTTAFDDTGTDTLKVGHSTDDDILAETGDSDLSAAGTYISVRGTGLLPSAATDFYALYAGQNSNATAGAGYVVVVHMPNVDKQA